MKTMHCSKLDFDRICRVCMRSRRLTPIFGRTTKAGTSYLTSKDYSSVITCYAAVQVSKGDGLPQNICYGCISLLNTITYFKSTCEKSYTRLQEIYRLQVEDSPSKSIENPTDCSWQDDAINNEVNIMERIAPTPLCKEMNTDLKHNSKEDNYLSSQENDDTFADTSDITVRRTLPVEKTNEVVGKIQSLIDSVKVNKRPRKLIGSELKQRELKSIHRNVRLKEIATLHRDRILKNMILHVDAAKKKMINPELCRKVKAMFSLVKSGVLIPGTKKEKVTNLVQCRECSSIIQQSSMRGHFQKHMGYKYICEHCGNRFASEKVMEQHCMARHGKEKTFECKTCKYRTAYKSEFTIHQRSHTGERPFTCDICGRGFHRRQCLIKHITLHSHLRPYQCAYCPKTFRNKNDLPAHVNSLHHRRYVYKCTECDATYAKLTSVRKHLAALHRVPRERQGKVPRIILT